MEVKNIREAKEWFEVLQTTDQCQTAIMMLAPGKESGHEPESHAHSDQSMLVVTGSIRGQVGNETMDLHAGDVVIVSSGTQHRFWNESDQPAMTFNVYSPPEYPADAKGRRFC